MRIALPLGLLMSFSCGSMPEHGLGHLEDAGPDSGTDSIADAGAADAGAGDAGAGDAGAADAGPGDAGQLPSPVVVTAVTLVTHGTIQISWQLPATGCSALALAMKVGLGGSYSTVQMLGGSATTTQHGPGHGSGTYCYRVVCTLNGVSSDPSNEKCASQ